MRHDEERRSDDQQRNRPHPARHGQCQGRAGAAAGHQDDAAEGPQAGELGEPEGGDEGRTGEEPDQSGSSSTKISKERGGSNTIWLW